MNAVIVDIQGKYAAAMDENGNFIRVKNKEYEIGQVVVPEETKKRGARQIVKTVGYAAASLILLSGIGMGTAYAIPYGTVSLDVNPSLEYTINCFDYVIDVNAVNEDGEDVLADLDVSSLKNKKIETAIANTVEQIETGGYLNSDDSEILISAGTKSANHSEKLSRGLETVISEDMGLPTRGVSVSQEDIERAHENGITAGRQWEHDNGAGNDEEMNNTPEAQNESVGQDNNRPVVGDPSGEMDSAGIPTDEKR